MIFFNLFNKIENNKIEFEPEFQSLPTVVKSFRSLDDNEIKDYKVPGSLKYRLDVILKGINILKTLKNWDYSYITSDDYEEIVTWLNKQNALQSKVIDIGSGAFCLFDLNIITDSLLINFFNKRLQAVIYTLLPHKRTPWTDYNGIVSTIYIGSHTNLLIPRKKRNYYDNFRNNARYNIQVYRKKFLERYYNLWPHIQDITVEEGFVARKLVRYPRHLEFIINNFDKPLIQDIFFGNTWYDRRFKHGYIGEDPIFDIIEKHMDLTTALELTLKELKTIIPENPEGENFITIETK